MKIFKLLEGPIETRFVDKNSKANFKQFNIKKSKKLKDQDSGYFYTAAQHRKDPHMINKHSVRSTQRGFQEGFKLFIEFLINKGYTSNPHMPRVYKVTTIKGRDGYKLQSFEVEKLLTWEQLEPEELAKTVEQLLDIDRLDDSIRNESHEVLASYIHKAINENITKLFTLETLNEACQIIREAIREIGGQYDLHYNNILFRRSQYGLQVVLNDPIFIYTSNDD